VGEAYFSKGANRKRFVIKRIEADRRAPPVRFKRERERETLAGARELPAITGDDPRRGRGKGGYRCAREIFPRRTRVDTSKGKHHSDGQLLSGGRRRRVSSDLTGERFYHQIEVGVRRGGGFDGFWQSLGGGDGLTRENRVGIRGGSRRIEAAGVGEEDPPGVL